MVDKDEEDAKRLEEFLLDENRVMAAQKEVTKNEILENVTKMAEALQQDNVTTDFDELD